VRVFENDTSFHRSAINIVYFITHALQVFEGTVCVLVPVKHTTMADNKINVGQQDRVRIDANDPSEVEYVHRQYPHLRHEQVLEAIQKVGPDRETVIQYLKNLK
jgi:hypothetical protein